MRWFKLEVKYQKCLEYPKLAVVHNMSIVKIIPVKGWGGLSKNVKKCSKLAVMHMSHFAYVCKMRCPLNLVLEKSKYLWFY